ncbi:PTS lactose/cellobiose transporter subunit IIA [Cetobacterium sp.]|uniref:PTS lactose/cellobiose transporter subunit IIA n=1 Tax=Cetobacterium sp. TaxID=2071632 RepID=UPI003F3BE970
MNNTEFISEETLEKIMTGVAVAGTAKSLGKEALAKANKGDFKEARNLFSLAKKQFIEVHGYHFDFIQKEASGERVDICLLLVHMEDHIMTTSLFLDSLEDQINLIERVCKLENLINSK